MRHVPEGGRPLEPPLWVFRALAPKPLSAMWIQGLRGGAPEKKKLGRFWQYYGKQSCSPWYWVF